MGLTEPRRVVLTIRKVKESHARRLNGEKTGDLAREIGVSALTLRAAWRQSRLGPITRTNYCIDETMVFAAIKARTEGAIWKDVPAIIGSGKSVNAIRLAVYYHKKKSGS